MFRYGAGITNLDSIHIDVEIHIYFIFCFLVEDILRMIVNNSMFTIASTKANGAQIILVTPSFGVVKT